MVNWCIVCKTVAGDPNECFRSYHRFPTDGELFNKWLVALNMTKATKSTTVCSDHFNPDDFIGLKSTLGAKRKLKKDVVPDLNAKNEYFILTDGLDSDPTKNNPETTKKPAKDDFELLCTLPKPDKRNVGHRPLKGLSRKHFNSDEGWQKYRSNYFEIKKKLKIANQSIVKKKQKLTVLRTALKSRDHPESDALLENIPSTLKEIVLRCHETSRTTKEYSPEMKSFAIEFKSLSTRAYEFVREEFANSLPAPSRIDTWKSAIKSKAPGIKVEVVDHCYSVISPKT